MKIPLGLNANIISSEMTFFWYFHFLIAHKSDDNDLTRRLIRVVKTSRENGVRKR